MSAPTCAAFAPPVVSLLSRGSAHSRPRGDPRCPGPSCSPSPTPQPRLEDGDPRRPGFPIPGAPPPAPGPRVLWSGSAEDAGTGRAGWTGWAPPGCTRRVVHWPAQRSGNEGVRAACAGLGAQGVTEARPGQRGSHRARKRADGLTGLGEHSTGLLARGGGPGLPWMDLGSTCHRWPP